MYKKKVILSMTILYIFFYFSWIGLLSLWWPCPLLESPSCSGTPARRSTKLSPSRRISGILLQKLNTHHTSFHTPWDEDSVIKIALILNLILDLTFLSTNFIKTAVEFLIQSQIVYVQKEELISIVLMFLYHLTPSFQKPVFLHLAWKLVTLPFSINIYNG